ncbi:hypothetical protein Cgig2_030913 [Carnegiea gigantea]|uniref:Uncharacterized protein n=1 Tax=Carnegiea gigantea TaxID=171969 RepID=A0A9Q1KGU5_9CARY|nr:hypothetical protein Cgig2_030913 [Carnegiea gigantea]
MTDTIMQQVTEQVKKAVEFASSARRSPHFNYVLTTGCEPSHRHVPVASYCHSDEVRKHPMLKRPQPMTAAPKPQNVQKYYEFHEQNMHTTAECRELRKTLHELANKGQIDRFLKRKCEPARPDPREEESSTEIATTTTGGYVEGNTRSAWKAQLRGAQQEVNPTGIIRLSLRFRNKNKARNVEVDFLVVDVPMAYNVRLGRSTLNKVEIHQLRISTLSLGLTTILYVFDIHFEIAILAESVGNQGLYAVLVSLPIALMLGFGGLLSPRCGLGLFLGRWRSPFRPPRPLSLFQRHLYLVAASSNFRHFIWSKGLGNNSTGLVEEKIATRRKEVEKRFGFTSVMVTYSSVTFDGSIKPEGARAQDLVQGCVLEQSEEVEDVVEGEVENIHDSFEDSKEAFEDAIVSLKEEEGESRAYFSL